jgi:catalase
LTYLFDDIGIPKNFRHINSFSINTFQMINANGEQTFFRWRVETLQGEQGQTDEEALTQHFSAHTYDMITAISQGNFPRYNVYIQTMKQEQFPNDFDPLDATKDWPLDRFPKRKVGEMVLNQTPVSMFTDNELIGFAVSRLVPGIEPSADKLLQSRLFAYADTQTYRLGINNQMLPINAPKCPFRDNHVDGYMHCSTNTASVREINYFPSGFDTAVKETPPVPHDTTFLQGNITRTELRQHDDFKQAGDRWRSFDGERKQRFADRVALSLSGELVTAKLREVWLGYWRKVDPILGDMIASNLKVLSADPKENLTKELEVRRTELMTLLSFFDRTSAAVK